MPRPLSQRLLVRGAKRVPGVKRIPMLKLLAITDIALLARDHMVRLTPAERRRAFQLVRKGRGRTTSLTVAERAELARLVAKADPRLFAGLAADRLSPVPLPRRVVRGPRRSR